MSHIPSNTFPPSLERSFHSSLFEKGKQLLDLVVMQGIASKDFYNYLGKKNPWLQETPYLVKKFFDIHVSCKEWDYQRMRKFDIRPHVDIYFLS